MADQGGFHEFVLVVPTDSRCLVSHASDVFLREAFLVAHNEHEPTGDDHRQKFEEIVGNAIPVQW